MVKRLECLDLSLVKGLGLRRVLLLELLDCDNLPCLDVLALINFSK